MLYLIKKWIRNSYEEALQLILDIVAPQNPVIKELETMSVHDFIRKTRCTETHNTLEGIQSILSYKNPLVKKAILEVKSHGNKKIANLLGSVLSEYLVAELEDLTLFNNFTHPVLIPIPITKKSRRARGWNQCELILESLVHSDYFEIDVSTLQKTKETADQVGKNRVERFKNLKGCFSVHNPEKIKNRNVILFDDIVTTGATLGEAQRALKKVGVKNILLVALAH